MRRPIVEIFGSELRNRRNPFCKAMRIFNGVKLIPQEFAVHRISNRTQHIQTYEWFHNDRTKEFQQSALRFGSTIRFQFKLSPTTNTTFMYRTTRCDMANRKGNEPFTHTHTNIYIYIYAYVCVYVQPDRNNPRNNHEEGVLEICEQQKIPHTCEKRPTGKYTCFAIYALGLQRYVRFVKIGLAEERNECQVAFRVGFIFNNLP